jgi:hypothetical protein
MQKPLTLQLEELGPFDITGNLPAAKQRWLEWRLAAGYSGAAKLLTPPEGNLKLSKLSGMTLPNYGLTLAPAVASGNELCIWRSPECTSSCVLVTAGKATLPSVRKARVVKSQFLAAHPQDFVLVLADEIRKAQRKHATNMPKAMFAEDSIAVRLNVASDLRWERIAPQLFELHGVTFYDYTKAPASQRDDLGGRYHLTFSVSERPQSEREAVQWLERGGSAAVVFDTKRGEALPSTWNGYTVVDADVQDGRYTDPPGVVAGLRAKGSGRRLEAGGFVKKGIAT